MNTKDKRFRVKYFSRSDFAYGLGMDILDVYFPKTPEEFIKDINDALECYNIALYLKDENFNYKGWDSNKLKQYKEYAKDFDKEAKKFIACKSNFDLNSILDYLDVHYIDDFFVILNETNSYKKISKNSLLEVLNTKKLHLDSVLIFENISKFFANEIKEYFDSNIEAVESIIEAANAKDCKSKNNLYIPKIILQRRDDYLDKYITSEHPNLSYVTQILDLRFDPIINSKIRLKAKKKIEKLKQDLFNTGRISNTKIEVCFDDNSEKISDFSISGIEKIQVTYNGRWLKENLDYPTIFNNFIYVFGLTDSRYRITNLYNPRENSIFENMDSSDNISLYKVNRSFFMKNNISSISIDLYNNLLKHNGLTFEMLVSWFFKEYINQEFGNLGFIFNIPSEKSTYYEKCQIITSSLDSLLKQYSCFISEGKVDFELIEMDSKPLMIQNLNSKLEKKYCYGNGIGFQNSIWLLFSDQSPIICQKKFSVEYHSFNSLICNEDVKLSDFTKYGASAIEFLINEGLLELDSNNFIKIKDKVACAILLDLYKNQFLPYWSLTPLEQSKVDILVDKGYLTISSTFLAKQESDYFNYILNKHFSNGMELRDTYAHGMAQLNQNEKVHYWNYLLLMQLIFIFIIKINDELCCYEKIQKGV